MPLIVLTADIDDGAAWEKAFRTHGDLFEAAGIGPINYTVTADDRIVMVTNVPDVDEYMEFMQSEATQTAMKDDGVDRDSVQVFVMDKSFAD